MPVLIWEKFDSRPITAALDAGGSVDLKIGVKGTDDDAMVAAAVEATMPTMYGHLYFHQYHLEPQGGGCWDVTVRYGAKNPRGTIINFDVAGGTQKLFQSYGTNTYGEDGSNQEGHIDFSNAINVGQDKKAKGVDVQIPKCSFTATRIIPPAHMTSTYANLLFALVKTPVNSDTVTIWSQGMQFVFDPGELIYHGACGGFREVDWEFVLKFSYEPNIIKTDENGDPDPLTGTTDLAIGPIADIEKDGWDYLWPYYEQQVGSANVILPVPKQVQVERVYKRAALQQLFGGPAAPTGLTAALQAGGPSLGPGLINPGIVAGIEAGLLDPALLGEVTPLFTVTLNWGAVVGAGTTSYNVYRGTSPGGEIPVAVGLTSTSYLDPFFVGTPDTPLYYKVTAVDPTGESAPSAEVSA